MRYLPASGGYDAGLDGMTNICELLINSVTVDKPKMLIRLEPKGT
jgi:hypothetical protein